MTDTVTLTPAEIREAIGYWLELRGRKAKGFIHLWQDPGDPPTSGPNIYAKAEVEITAEKQAHP